jgi:hypothetical protein
MGTAIVLVAATAPTRARRAAEAGAGAIVAAVCGGWAAHSATLAGAGSPAAFVHVVSGDPAPAAAGLAMIAFAVLLPFAWCAERRTQAAALWGLGFGLAAIGVPYLLASGGNGLGAGIAAALTGIIPAVWAVAGPRPERGG